LKSRYGDDCQESSNPKTTPTPSPQPRTTQQQQQRPPIDYTKPLTIKGDACFANAETFVYRGQTADGRPWYSADVTFLGLKADVAYIFYDANCDGKVGKPYAAHGHPQWIMSRKKPLTDRLVDVDGTGKCVRDQDDGGSYSKAENFDWTPPIPSEGLVSCPNVFGVRKVNFVYSRTLMRCTDSFPMTGVGAPHQRSIEVALCYGIFADVHNCDNA